MSKTSCLGFFLALSVIACVDRVPIEGAPCPCAAGWTCDTSRDLCIASESTTKVPANCPAHGSPGLSHGRRCDLPNGTLCGYQEHGSFLQCASGCEEANAWACHGYNGTNSPACPLSRPTNDAPCSFAVTCPYLPPPGSDRPVVCGCTSAKVWDCTSDEPPLPCRKPPVAGTYPPGIDPALRISALSDEQAEAWCTWYLSRDGSLLPPPGLPEKTPGIADMYGATFCGTPIDLCGPVVPVEVCAQNLKLFPCQATVAELSDCALTVGKRCTLVGGGCGPFKTAANCSQTFLQVNNGQTCHVRYR